jgi:hypothetical protein
MTGRLQLRVTTELLAALDREVERLTAPGVRVTRSSVAVAMLASGLRDAERRDALRQHEAREPPREWRIGDECEVLFDDGCEPEWREGVVCGYARSDMFAGHCRVADTTHGADIRWSTWAHPSEMRERGR